MGLFSAEEPQQYEIDDKQLICMFCSNDSFYQYSGQLRSPSVPFLTVLWTDRDATCFACSSCGYLHWFMR